MWQALEREYNVRGWRSVMWTETAVLDEDRGAVDFYQDKHKNNQVGWGPLSVCKAAPIICIIRITHINWCAEGARR